MHRIPPLHLLIIFLFFGCKPYKILEQSNSERPNWVYGLQRNYIIVEGSGNNHEAAKMDAYTKIKERIVSTIATNVSSSSQLQVNEDNIDNIRTYRESFSTNTKVSSTLLNELRGISLNKAESFYWERIKKKDKSMVVNYHVKYPFSEMDERKLMQEWEMLNQQLQAEISELEKTLSNTNEINKIIEVNKRAISLSNILAEPSKTKANLVATKSAQILNNIKIHVINHQPGQIIIEINSNGRTLSSSNPLIFESKCASLITQEYVESTNRTIIDYESVFCNEERERKFELSTKINEREVKISEKIPYDDSKARISLLGNIQLLTPTNGPQIWRLNLRSFNEMAFTIKKIELNVEKINQRLLAALVQKPIHFFISRDLDFTFKGKQNFFVDIENDTKNNIYRTELEQLISDFIQTSGDYRASGKIVYQSANTEENNVFLFENVTISR